MFIKSLFICAATLSMSLQAHGHATFAPNQAAADALKKSDIKRAPNPCIAATALKNPIPVDANGQFVAFARSFDAGTDGATTIKAGQVDASAIGTTFKDGDVTEVSGGVASQPDNKGRQTVTFAMPKGVQCAGGSDKSSCLVSLTTSAGFVNCMAVTQAGSGAGTKAAAGGEQAAGNKQAASSSSTDTTATATSSAAEASSTSTGSGAAGTGNGNAGSANSGGANSDSQASQQVADALKQVEKIQQELDALIKSLGGNNNNNQANKNAAAKKAAAAKAADAKKAQDSQNNSTATTTAATSTETGATATATSSSAGATATATSGSNVTRDLAEDDEDDCSEDDAELATRDLDEDEEDELVTRDLAEDDEDCSEDDAEDLATRDLEDDEDEDDELVTRDLEGDEDVETENDEE